jgi:hypothetical protein
MEKSNHDDCAGGIRHRPVLAHCGGNDDATHQKYQHEFKDSEL